jgi:hypothetical protein
VLLFRDIVVMNRRNIFAKAPPCPDHFCKMQFGQYLYNEFVLWPSSQCRFYLDKFVGGGLMKSLKITFACAAALASGIYSAGASAAVDSLLGAVQSTVGSIPVVGSTLGEVVDQVDGILNSAVVGTVGGLPVMVPVADSLFDGDVGSGDADAGPQLPNGLPLLLPPP